MCLGHGQAVANLEGEDVHRHVVGNIVRDEDLKVGTQLALEYITGDLPRVAEPGANIAIPAAGS